MTSTAALSNLNQSMLATLKTSERVSLPAYDRTELPVAVLHVGPGAFFRAHQADYFDRLNALDPKWGIAAVALRSRKAPEALRQQDGLYTLVTLDRETDYRVIGSLLRTDYFEDDVALGHFSKDTLRLITLTITEKGYCLDGAGQLDMSHPDIQQDCTDPESPVSALGWLLKGLNARMSAGVGGLTILSCDNLPSNGRKLEAAMQALAKTINPELAEWISEHVDFPSSMVDSITPATTSALIQRVESQCGYRDEWPIQRESFTSWVIENPKRPDFPALDRVGVIFTDDVEAHEQAKLRMLNGTHSSLAYLGLAYGNASVASAMENRPLAELISKMMTDEIIPSIDPPDGMDVHAYGDALLERYRNPSIRHELRQIAWDGSKKLPIRLLQTIRDNLSAGRPVSLMSKGVAAWMRFVIRMARTRQQIVDPMSETLNSLGLAANDRPEHDVIQFTELTEVFGSDLRDHSVFLRGLTQAYADVIEIEKMHQMEEAQGAG